jgi:pimeloyl-ACP methyl ester carboxylesterase
VQSIFLDHPNGRVHTLRFGQGEKLLIALHGFGDRARMFAVLEEALGKNYTVVAVDWPFHGQTEWTKDTFTKEDLLSVIRQILSENGKERFCLMGFSFGARLTQAMLPELAPQLDKLYLFSPDGVKTKGMTMAVHTPMWMRRLLFRILKKPDWFINLVNFGRKTGLVPPLIHHFLTNNLNRPERLQRTFGCWFVLDSFYLRRRDIRAILEKTGLPTDVYIGLNDRYLHQKALKKLYEGLPNVRVFMLDEGHRLVGEGLGDLLIHHRADAS